MLYDRNIKTDLDFLKDYEVVVFGSYASKNANVRSDIDIAVITREHDRDKCLQLWKEILGQAPQIYDIKIFELLPLQIKMSVIKNHKTIFGNSVDISEYFYYFRKLWNDAKHRIEDNQFTSTREKIAAMTRFKNYKLRTMSHS
ncbi:MAG TPA: nucleotidyltransferase domain-containing protein [Methanosarcinaceae archaeon]|nr:nucleotidyltransferase domain-containing protein [Methanosarcinaceae archaeon]